MLLAVVATGCGTEESSNTRLTASELESCIVQVGDFAATGAARDASGRVRAMTTNATVAYQVKATWTLTNGALVMREPVNEVTLEFFKPDGSAATEVEFSSFRLVMDMGGHGHTTDECPAKAPVVTKVNANTLRINYINFVMSSRTPDKWFFYNFTAKVQGVSGVVARFNVPHKIN
jgi:hypothetical protein